MDAKDQELLEKVAKYYAIGGNKLEDEVTDEEIEKVSKLCQDTKIESKLNELIKGFQTAKKKK